MKIHCLFEQSGTFKNEFKKLGYEAIDYDILNEFGETDNIIDLFKEIRNAYTRERESIFDFMNSEDLVMAFFPCVRFENQSLLLFRGDNSGFKNWDDERKLKYDLKLHEELAENYELITKLVLICKERNLKLIIENPYSSQHYLIKYWALKPSLIIKNRREYGDYYEKPTMFYFVNCSPKNNFLFEPQVINKKLIVSQENKTTRSLMSKDFANRFIREFILDYKE